MKPRVVIDCFPSSVSKYNRGYAVVAIDVIRATTTAITAVMAGRRCFPVATLEDAHHMQQRLGDALLAGELHGDVPAGFDLNNSPVQLAEADARLRPVVLLSTSGTQLMCLSAACDAAYVASFRNYKAVVEALLERDSNVALVGAGSRNEFREEDQMCCAWIAEQLIQSGYRPENSLTSEVTKRWSGATAEACLDGNSAKYLRKTGQLEDLEFVLNHVNDVDRAFMMLNSEVVPDASRDLRVANIHEFGQVAA